MASRLDIKFPKMETPEGKALVAALQQFLASLNDRLEKPAPFRIYSRYNDGTYIEFSEDGTLNKSVAGVVTPVG